jgi:hypothetical protein
MDKSVSEDGNSIFLWNVGMCIFCHTVGTHLPDYMVLKPRKPQYEPLPL